MDTLYDRVVIGAGSPLDTAMLVAQTERVIDGRSLMVGLQFHP